MAEGAERESDGGGEIRQEPAAGYAGAPLLRHPSCLIVAMSSGRRLADRRGRERIFPKRHERTQFPLVNGLALSIVQ